MLVQSMQLSVGVVFVIVWGLCLLLCGVVFVIVWRLCLLFLGGLCLSL